MNTPSPSEIKAIREQELQVSTSIFAEALGYPGGERLVQALEHGKRNGIDFTMSGPVVQAMRYLRAINKCVRDFDTGMAGPSAAIRRLRESLPKDMQ